MSIHELKDGSFVEIIRYGGPTQENPLYIKFINCSYNSEFIRVPKNAEFAIAMTPTRYNKTQLLKLVSKPFREFNWLLIKLKIVDLDAFWSVF